jgi:hypothetical protein
VQKLIFSSMRANDRVEWSGALESCCCRYHTQHPQLNERERERTTEKKKRFGGCVCMCVCRLEVPYLEGEWKRWKGAHKKG